MSTLEKRFMRLRVNIEAALTSFATDSASQYREVFQQVGTGDLAQWMNEIGPLTFIYIADDVLQYRFEQPVDGVSITFLVTFMNENGQWKVAEF